MIKKPTILSVLWITWVAGLSFVSLVSAADDDPSAQQALAQLRILQKRLAPTSTQHENVKVTDKLVTTPTPTLTPVVGAASPAGAAPVTSTLVEPVDDMQAAVDEKKHLESLAFNSMAEQLFPLSPEEIVRIRQLYNTQELALITTPGAPPKPTATSQFVNLSPGSTPPVIRLSQGFVSSLVFLDSTGSPWPISAYDLGDPSAFNIQWDKSGNTLMIQASNLYTYGNLAVKLRGLNTPVMLTLIPGQKAVDYRVDLRVQGYGPNAKTLTMDSGLPPAASDLLLHVLDGVPPEGSARLIVSGGDARAWLLNERMYVRTNLTILSPGWLESMTSADGTHAYEMQKSPVLLVSWHGKVMQLKVEGL